MSKQSGRRKFIQTAGAATAALAFPYIRTSHAAGNLSVAFWDHWVPGANDTLTKICQDWAAKEKVAIKIDYLTTQGNKLQLTAQAEAQAKAGHDLIAMLAWDPLEKQKQLEPMDDVIGGLEKQYGKVVPAMEYLGKAKGKWIAVPSPTGTQVKPPCARLDIWKQAANIDFQKMYPAGSKPTAEAENWTYDTMLKAAPALQKAGHPLGLGLGQTTDSIDWVGAMFHAFGADLVDAKGNVIVKTNDAVKQVLEYMQQLVKYLPPDVFAWDDASNNKYLISGQGSMIFNPPSAWSVAKRDNPKVAEQCWTFSMPKGPKGRFVPYLPIILGTWSFSKNKSAAKSLLREIWQRPNVEKLVAASNGYDVPSFQSMRDFKTWEEVSPPKGTVYHYPPRDDETPWVSGAPAPANVANQMYVQSIMTKMIAKCTQGGDSVAKTLDWATSEIEGYSRT
ncbi:MAG: extracellular solute-binding protein [Betaproteobacteria bacterium]|nr:extracellular solute-binding protein [Betaproteobacteria bacterium]